MRRRSLLQNVWAHYTNTIPESQNPALGRPRPPSNHPHHQRTPVQDGRRHQVHPAQRLHNIEYARGRERGSALVSRASIPIPARVVPRNNPLQHRDHHAYPVGPPRLPIVHHAPPRRDQRSLEPRNELRAPSHESRPPPTPQTRCLSERVPAPLPTQPHRHRPRRPRSDGLTFSDGLHLPHKTYLAFYS